MKRFIFWIILFFLLLGIIPILIQNDYISIAKLAGILTLITIIVALWYWRIQTRKKSYRNQRIQISINDRYWLSEHIVFYKNLSKADKEIFEDRVGIFIADVPILSNKQIEREDYFYVASSAVIAFWGLPYWDYNRIQIEIVESSDFDSVALKEVRICIQTLMDFYQKDDSEQSLNFNYLEELNDNKESMSSLIGQKHREFWYPLVDLSLNQKESKRSDFLTVLDNLKNESRQLFLSLYQKSTELD
jgi:hypothetical protein